MSTEAARTAGAGSSFEILRLARKTVQHEAAALEKLAADLNDSFVRGVDLLSACAGRVLVTGMGKAGLVGRKIAATLASTGTPAHFLHPAEAVHGDLGTVTAADVVLVLSHSGETDEIVRLLPSLSHLGARVLAVTAHAESTLARHADESVLLGQVEEADALGLAPTTSTTLMMALGDALALALSHRREFARSDFYRYHPGGSLGRRLSRVEDLMRPLQSCRVAPDTLTVRDVFVRASKPGRRTGAVMLVDGNGGLSGIFTDSDLSRLLENRRDAAIDEPIYRVMTRHPQTVPCGARVEEAMALISDRKISEIPVVDTTGKPVGMIDITDLLGEPRPAESPHPATHLDASNPQTVPFPTCQDEESPP